MICRNCGNVLDSGSSFCPKCGTKKLGDEQGALIHELKMEDKRRSANAVLAVLILCGVLCGGCIGFLTFQWFKAGSIAIGIIISFFFIYDAIQRSRFQKNTSVTIYENRIEGISCPFNQLLMLRADTQHFSCNRQNVKQVEVFRGVILKIHVNEKSYCIHAGNKNEAQKIKAVLESR